jgi:hypothetical protein
MPVIGYCPDPIQAQQSNDRYRQLDCHGGTAGLTWLYFDEAIMRLDYALAQI